MKCCDNRDYRLNTIENMSLEDFLEKLVKDKFLFYLFRESTISIFKIMISQIENTIHHSKKLDLENALKTIKTELDKIISNTTEIELGKIGELSTKIIFLFESFVEIFEDKNMELKYHNSILQSINILKENGKIIKEGVIDIDQAKNEVLYLFNHRIWVDSLILYCKNYEINGFFMEKILKFVIKIEDHVNKYYPVEKEIISEEILQNIQKERNKKLKNDIKDIINMEFFNTHDTNLELIISGKPVMDSLFFILKKFLIFLFDKIIFKSESNIGNRITVSNFKEQIEKTKTIKDLNCIFIGCLMVYKSNEDDLSEMQEEIISSIISSIISLNKAYEGDFSSIFEDTKKSTLAIMDFIKNKKWIEFLEPCLKKHHKIDANLIIDLFTLFEDIEKNINFNITIFDGKIFVKQEQNPQENQSKNS